MDRLLKRLSGSKPTDRLETQQRVWLIVSFLALTISCIVLICVGPHRIAMLLRLAMRVRKREIRPYRGRHPQSRGQGLFGKGADSQEDRSMR